MSEHANIFILNSDHSFDFIMDKEAGMPNTLGSILNTYYQSEDKVRHLIELGDTEHIGITTAPSHTTITLGGKWQQSTKVKRQIGLNDDVHERATTADKVWDALQSYETLHTLAESRDLGKHSEKTHSPNLHDIKKMKYNYLYIPDGSGHGKWYFCESDIGDKFTLYGKENKWRDGYYPPFLDLNRFIQEMKKEGTNIEADWILGV